MGRPLKVTRDESADDNDRTFTAEQIAGRVNKKPSSVVRDARNPSCPLKWTHWAGKAKACDLPTLRRYLDWLRIDRPLIQASA
jgi:hypothetical protein